MYAKRFWLALIFGTVAGLVCAWTGYAQTPEDIRTMVFVSVVLNRALIGFIIGISAWKMGWVMHGLVIGLIGTLPLSAPLIFTAEAGFEPFLIYTVAGLVWGFLIELLVTKLFKAPMR